PGRRTRQPRRPQPRRHGQRRPERWCGMTANETIGDVIKCQQCGHQSRSISAGCSQCGHGVPLHIRQAGGLRALADMIEANPDIEASYLKGLSGFSVWFASSPEQLAAIARAALKHGAKVDKDIDDELYNLDITFGVIKTRALAQRNEVC